MNRRFNQFFNADDGAGAGGGDFVEMKNPFTGEPVKVPRYLESFIGAVASFNRKGAAEKASGEIERLKMELDDAKIQAAEAGKTKGLDKQVEQMKAEHEKAIKAVSEQAQKFEQEAGAWRGKYEDTRISNDLFSALPAAELHNPAQTMATIRALGKPRLVEKFDINGSGTGLYETVLEMDGAALPAKEYITKFFSADENKFHLKNKLAPGGGTTAGNQMNTNGGGGKAITRAEFDKMNAAERSDAIKNGATISEN